MQEHDYIGIDIGGSKTEIVLMDRVGNELFRKREDNRADMIENIALIAGLVQEARSFTDRPTTIGLGAPGWVMPKVKQIKSLNVPWLNDEAFISHLEHELGADIRIQNDAKCFALSEHLDGAGQAFDNGLYVILGTGVGSALIVNNKLVEGQANLAGEWGQLPFYGDPDRTIENVVSGPALEIFFSQKPDHPMTAKQIAQECENKNAEILTLMEEWVDLLAQALSPVVNLLMPHVIVFGGGLSHLKEIYTLLPDKLKKHSLMNLEIVPAVLPAKHGDSSGVRGAAFLWRD
jgi:fructokinase